MKTNFFQQIAGLGFNGNFLLNIHQDEKGVQTVSVALKRDKAVDGLPPMLFKATAEELDEGFFAKLTEPVKQTAGLISNIETYQKELDKAKKNAKPDKGKAGKPAETDSDEDDNDDENNLFTPPEDDKEAKAEKKRLYDEAMEKVKQLAQNTKYAEALANLPDVADYPDKAEAIEAKRRTLQAGKDAYDKLTASFND
ncbi:PRTRC system protein E [Mucilaginibacter sp. AK015]|uniref:PRTRC system protein E n=1 Tax=Mucilaginibacter sp. AK015 TaxID=2723072 RepID=UPI0016188AEF|nr:PRTRC system protein E [Mucilaginibacter sp. AK015]MBB5395145.1 PRTRC genetic system protein E [Mucilaginibacter sp. AK015]